MAFFSLVYTFSFWIELAWKNYYLVDFDPWNIDYRRSLIKFIENYSKSEINRFIKKATVVSDVYGYVCKNNKWGRTVEID